MKNYTPIIGMEIHVELKTQSKMFCACAARYFGQKPNTHCCPVCLGLPGALPVPNKKAIEWCIKLGLALGCEIPLFAKFDRKNYFYPDLPKGYQISQYDEPFAVNGKLTVGEKTIRIRRVHMEEDTAKLTHARVLGEEVTLVDFNRSGVPLVEIVTEPDIRSSEEARLFLKKLHQIVRYLNISDADMEKGSMRLEPNISVKSEALSVAKLQEEDLPKYKVEVKNINSFSFVKKAIDFETKRHAEILEKGQIPDQETRGWNEKKNVTESQRKKEAAHDYRYFPEPDIPPIRWEKSQITNLKSQISELPDEKKVRFLKEYILPEQDAERLTDTVELAKYFEELVKQTDIKPKDIANWILNKKIDIQTVSKEELIAQITAAKTVVTVTNEELEKILGEVISENEKAVVDYKSGKTTVVMFLVGQAMKKLKGKGDAQLLKQKLEEKLR